MPVPTTSHRVVELADIASKARGKTSPVISPIAFEAVQKIDAVFTLEREINGLSPVERVAARRNDIASLVNDFIDWLKRERAKLSRHIECKGYDLAGSQSQLGQDHDDGIVPETHWRRSVATVENLLDLLRRQERRQPPEAPRAA